MKMKISYLIIYSLIIQFIITKKVSSTLYFSTNDKFIYITKFAFISGGGFFSFRANSKIFENQINFNLNIYNDEEFSNSKNIENCDERVLRARYSKEINLNPINSFIFQFNHSFQEEQKTQMWFFTLSNCNFTKAVKNSYFPISIELNITNLNKEEFSNDESGILGVLLVILSSSILSLLFLLLLYHKESKRMSSFMRPTMILLFALITFILSNLFDIINYLIFSYDGKGSPFFHIISLLMEIFSQYLVTLLLILLSWGWTITFVNIIDLELYIPLIVMSALIHLIIAGLTYVTFDEESKFHDYEGFQGIMLIFIRITIWIFFLIGSNESKSYCDKEKLYFIHMLNWVGSLYMIFFPLNIIIGYFFPHHYRFYLFKFFSLTGHICYIILMAFILTSKSAYYKASDQSTSILPGIKSD